MKLIIHNDEKEVLLVEEIDNPSVENKTVRWNGGIMREIKMPFLILESEVDLIVGDIVKDEVIAQDTKINYQKRDLEKENTDLKKQVTDLTFELMMKGVL